MRDIGVAMCTYNGAQFLRTQLDSILSQKLSPVEIIIVDDGSTDDTKKILVDYAQRYSQIQLYFNSQRLGVMKSFEKALTLCSCELIAISDQDDVWLPNKLEVLNSNINDALLIHSDAKLVDKDLNVISDTYNKVFKSYKFDRSLDYLMHNNVTGCTTMISRRLLEYALPFPESVVMYDNYLAFLAFHYGRIVYISQPLILYRQHNSNLIGAGVLSYEQFLTANEKRYLYSLEISTKEEFKYLVDLPLITKYSYNIFSSSKPSIELLIWIWKNFSWKNFFGYLLLTCFGKRVAKFSYEVLNKIV